MKERVKAQQSAFAAPVRSEANPYEAIEEDIYGEEQKKRRKKRRNASIHIGVAGALLVFLASLAAYDIAVNILRETGLPEGTLVSGMTYRELREKINAPGEGKTWIDFDDPYEVAGGEQTPSSINISLSGGKLTVKGQNDGTSFLLVDPDDRILFQRDRLLADGVYDFSTGALPAGDYILCAIQDPYTIPYRLAVDAFLSSRIGSYSFRRASEADGSIQTDGNITLIQDPTLLCLSLIRIS